MKTILFTGGLGFIGYNTIKCLIRNFKVICIDNFDPFYKKEIKDERLRELLTHNKFTFLEIDICDLEKMEEIFKLNKIDVIIHFASKANVVESNYKKNEYFLNNSIGYFNILFLMEKYHVTKIVSASSSSVYGNGNEVPYNEDLSNVDNPLSIYASTKRQNEILTSTFSDSYNIDAVQLRFFTVYGIGQRPDLAISKFTNLILSNKEIEIYGNIDKKRDFTHIDDIVSGVVKALEFILENRGNHIINLGSSKPISVDFMIKTISNILDKEPIIKIIDSPVGDVDITYADIKKAKNILNWEPKISFTDGMNNFVNHYKKGVK